MVKQSVCDTIIQFREKYVKKNCACLCSVLLFAFVSVASVSASGVSGSGKIVKKTLDVRNISGVSNETMARLIIEQGNSESLALETDENLMEYFHASVRSGMLIIEQKPMANLHPSRDVVFTLRVRSLDSIILAGSGSIETDALETKKLSVSIDGSGSIKADSVKAGELSLEINGSGDISVRECVSETVTAEIGGSGSIEIEGAGAAGPARHLKVRSNGSGDFDGADFPVTDASVSISGSGDIHVNASAKLDVKIDGSGDVRFGGNPEINSIVNGSGHVRED